jgi:hypothetical protein
MKKPNTTNKKLSEFSNRNIKLNLMKWIEFANDEQVKDGKKWYDEAMLFCKDIAKEYKIDAYTVATVVSCLSPNNKWEQNKKDTIATINYFMRLNSIRSGKVSKEDARFYLRKVKCCTYKANRQKAWQALCDGTEIQKSSPKTHSFAMNIAFNSSEHITIDKWHLRACQVPPKANPQKLQESCTALQYRNIERITADIAKIYNLKGYELQAIIWLAIKAKWER